MRCPKVACHLVVVKQQHLALKHAREFLKLSMLRTRGNVVCFVGLRSSGWSTVGWCVEGLTCRGTVIIHLVSGPYIP
jgi:hypothetical protein